jgi:GxxExxY protein
MDIDIDALLRKVLDAGTQVHATLGPGFHEGIYGRAFLVELRSRGLQVEKEKQIRIWYGSTVVGRHCLDLLVEKAVVVELKASQILAPIHAAQLHSYLHAAKCSIGILFNFGAPALQWEILHRENVAENPD